MPIINARVTVTSQRLPQTMESWMKRGFLQSSGTDSKPLTPGAVIISKKTTDDPDISSKPDRSLKQEVFKIPAIAIIDDNIPSFGRFPGGRDEVFTVKLPYDDDNHTTEPYTISLLYHGAKEALAAIPGFPAPYNPSIRVHYRIGDAPGAGKGMFALTNLDTGDLIARERPLFLFPQAIPVHSYAERDAIIEQTVLKMKPADVLDYFDLANCKTEGGRAAGIMRTNNLNAARMPGGYDGRYACVCRDLSRANHRLVAAYWISESDNHYSCSPNATYRWVLKDFMYELRAARRIKEGEEICITYVNFLRGRSARQEHLQSSYAFTCRCSACSMPSSEIPRSDIRRGLLDYSRVNENANDDSMLNAWCENTSLPDDYVIRNTMKFVTILEEEKLIQKDICKMYYSRLTKAYCALKDAKNAKIWARRTALMVTAADGDDMGWNKVADSPESTDWWGRRKSRS
ncbi:hypothetical protein F5887DRAFT_86342 [Amanita rubescens]|nr:hypothetical protein F5887DRAFT_86342 [Amanita rubescens]